jgi:hypothetical protein
LASPSQMFVIRFLRHRTGSNGVWAAVTNTAREGTCGSWPSHVGCWSIRQLACRAVTSVDRTDHMVAWRGDIDALRPNAQGLHPWLRWLQALTAPGIGSPLPTSETGLELTAATSAPRLGSPLPTSAPRLGSPLPTSAPGLGLLGAHGNALPIKCHAGNKGRELRRCGPPVAELLSHLHASTHERPHPNRHRILASLPSARAALRARCCTVDGATVVPRWSVK